MNPGYTIYSTDPHGQRHYWPSAARHNISARLPEPLHDFIALRTLGGQHGARDALTEILWTKLYEFVLALNLPPYSEAPTNYDVLRRKLALAQLTLQPQPPHDNV